MESSLLLRGAAIVGTHAVTTDASLLVRDGRIVHIGAGEGTREAQVLDLSGLTLWPGFVDVHNHGAAGIDVNEADADSLHTAARFLATRGVTGWLPTLVPAAEEVYARVAREVGRLMREQEQREPAARTLGLHYEGPFVNERQCGALRTQFFRTYGKASDADLLAEAAAGEARHLITLAPEVAGGVELIRELTRRGWIVSIGHTRAAAETLDRARAAGARHMTHFMNAMPQLHHREPGPVGWGLLHDEVTVDVIADGLHLDPLALRLVVHAKTYERVTLISDSVAPAGLGDGEFRLWDEIIRVSGGRTSNERGNIAGSVITMLDAALTMRRLGYAEPAVARMAALNPARLLGLDAEVGSIEIGKRADLFALDAEGRVRLTLVGGRIAFRAADES
jgi:N-acetylglucosamine-6-phosphate deacetylase